MGWPIGEVHVPQVHAPGAEAEVDWAEATVVLAGVATAAHLFVMRASFSGAAFCQTKQGAHLLGISVKTADRHVQNAYGKIGVSTRAEATLFAMEHGLAAWGELPISSAAVRS